MVLNLATCNSGRKIKYTDLESELSFILLFKKFPNSTARIPLLTDLEEQCSLSQWPISFPFIENPKSLTTVAVRDGVSLSKLSTIHGYIPKWCNWWMGTFWFLLPLSKTWLMQLWETVSGLWDTVLLCWTRLNCPSFRSIKLLVTQIYRKQI